MMFVSHRAAACRAAALCLGAAFGWASPQAGAAGADGDGPVNLHRVKVLLEGDARGVWLGDSWCRLNRRDRLPFGALATWPIADVTALCLAYNDLGGIARCQDFTAGEGSLLQIDGSNDWRVEFDGGEQAHFALPLSNLTLVEGAAGLQLTGTGEEAGWLQAVGANNTRFRLTDAGDFSQPGQSFRGRALYYAPGDPGLLPASVVIDDAAGTTRGVLEPRAAARQKWHLGGDPDSGVSTAPTPSQINAAPFDVALDEKLGSGAKLAIAQNPVEPLVGSGDEWYFAGATIYRVDGAGERAPGYYHTGLSQNSWTLEGHGVDEPSTGGKTYSDEQLLHWLDVTTLDRAQTPVVILHLDTEARGPAEIEASVRRILEKYRDAFGAIGTAPPRFLLVGSYMHLVSGTGSVAQSRSAIAQFNGVYRQIALSEPDCAYFSLYDATDGTFFTSDFEGGPGTQQAARDWLNANGWATITYGGETYNLSSSDNGGLDGIMIGDGLHITASPGAAFFAKLLGDAIAAAECPGDFNGDGDVNTVDVLAFLNAWNAGDGSADINGDGVIDTRDVVAFLNLWSADC